MFLTVIKITSQGNQYFEDQFEKRVDTSGREYFWIKGKIIDLDTSIKYDGKAVGMNYISITPIQFNFTNHTYLDELKTDLGRVNAK
jgi:5'-nucleotidase